ncbi:AbrB/MazE/SpoVT family DNA-binding domain-containing protein [Sulfobacillus thermosulfidooxidans]|uniref:AbrB/MazE/SpoVT family DNA-binding domain-containing protein n=1 Tax=Sulfobacillus thermosulfidooxidans TaxID=28034 RepID=UPI0006B652D1|nr:AbrB/MazE/SpoVT family DNA-binding domain-containing protein [Sulfobacillus thermosulfidooxidans]
MDKYLLQLRDRGVVTLPKTVRQHYGLGPDTPLTLVDWNGVFILSPRIPVVTELAKQIAAERAAAGLSVQDLLRAWTQERYGPDAPQSEDA